MEEKIEAVQRMQDYIAEHQHDASRLYSALSAL